MDASRARKLATKISDGLFHDGLGRRAKRLVLELEDGRDGGGWCQSAAMDYIASILVLDEGKEVMRRGAEDEREEEGQARPGRSRGREVERR